MQSLASASYPHMTEKMVEQIFSAQRSTAAERKPHTPRTLKSFSCACALFILSLATAISASGQTLTTLVRFNGKNIPFGNLPQGNLVQGFDGNFYGTTPYGGTCTWNCGTVFKVTPSGALTTLYEFCPQTKGCPSLPQGLTLGSNGDLYGVTDAGGKCSGVANGCGTFFQIAPSGTLTVLGLFDDSDGYNIFGPVTQASNGNFYGTTVQGGAYNEGTIYQATPGGTLTAIYSFCQLTGCPDGADPNNGLIQAANGNFYGTTLIKGANLSSCLYGCGTAFSITPKGKLTTLYNFCSQTGCLDGANPAGGLIQATDGNFYGATSSGGNDDTICDGDNSKMCGTIFKITGEGTLTTLYSFCAQTGCPDGSNPFGSLVQATDGNFYGVTGGGGGTIFKITSKGVLTTLYTFCAQTKCADGFSPLGLIQGTDGNLYGMTRAGGIVCNGIFQGCGTVFKLSVGLHPFVKTLPLSGAVGTPVTILGTNLTGATEVSFHGTTATFTVVSATEITTTVPIGATFGKVSVTTPSGTLATIAAFRVTP